MKQKNTKAIINDVISGRLTMHVHLLLHRALFPVSNYLVVFRLFLSLRWLSLLSNTHVFVPSDPRATTAL